jgi:isoleucyl-tRNA synthetase
MQDINFEQKFIEQVFIPKLKEEYTNELNSILVEIKDFSDKKLKDAISGEKMFPNNSSLYEFILKHINAVSKDLIPNDITLEKTPEMDKYILSTFDALVSAVKFKLFRIIFEEKFKQLLNHFEEKQYDLSNFTKKDI